MRHQGHVTKVTQRGTKVTQRGTKVTQRGTKVTRYGKERRDHKGPVTKVKDMRVIKVIAPRPGHEDHASNVRDNTTEINNRFSLTLDSAAAPADPDISVA